MLALACGVACRGAHPTASPRVIVLGFDGLDYALTRDLMAQGTLPNFTRLAAMGSFAPLGTSTPPQSPVAWSTFITGSDPGVHGIFDFVHRDPRTMLPYLSTTRTVAAGRLVTLGKWQFPLSPGRVELLRQGRAFWEVLEERGVPSTIIRMPANFPPSGKATRELSGMGTPDILGTYGVFSFFTSDPSAQAGEAMGGGTVYRVDVSRGVVHAALEGPDQPYLSQSAKMTATFDAYVDGTRQFVKIVTGPETRLLRVVEWSDWVLLSFDVAPMQTLPAEARFFLKQLTPHFELYVSPINIDPRAPAVPISTPAGFAAELAEAVGRFYTQGMPEDTKGLKTGVLTVDEFLQQAKIAQDENRRQYRYVLDRFTGGFLFHYFGNVDQVSHMLWRSLDPQHPAYRAEIDAPYAPVIPALYAELDAIVGETLDRLGSGDLLVVMSDHGFASWRRSFNLNSWLRDHGYLEATAGPGGGAPGLFNGVDWTRTRAYGLGLNGLYLNLRGREAGGVVDAAQREALLAKMTGELLQTIDPATGLPAISRVFRREQAYSAAGHDDLSPDLVMGYAKGTRVSDASALGELAPAVFTDNTGAWSGDHCMDPDAVPGILLTSRPLKRPAPTLQTLAAALLAEYGIEGFPKRN